jgi:hypothetical protein
METEIKVEGVVKDVDRAGEIHARGWNDDHRVEVFLLIDDMDVRPAIHNLIHYAYENGYEHPSDGISFPLRWYAQLGFQQFRMKHPVGVMHDMLTREGMACPFVKIAAQNGFIDATDETEVRRWGNAKFSEGLWDCGNWFRAYSWKFGLDMFGYPAWNKYRTMEARGDFSHVCNPAILRPPAVVPEAVIEKVMENAAEKGNAT